MTDQAEARAQAQARAASAGVALSEHTTACEGCALAIASDPENPPDCTEGARLYGDWLAAMLTLATTPRAPE